MRVLGIESSSLVASVALVTDDILTAEYTVDFKRLIHRLCSPMLDEIVKLLELDMDTIDAIAVAGPRVLYRAAHRRCHGKGWGWLLKALGPCSHRGCHGI